MMKWIMHLTGITIGRNIIVIFTLLLLGAFQCGEKIEPKDNNYTVWVHNVTSNKISIAFKDNYGEFSDAYPEIFIIANDSSSRFPFSPFGFNKTDVELNPVKYILNKNYITETLVYRNDSLKVTWKGPAADLPDSIHNFYNYNSWEVELTPNVPDQTGTLNFYIEETDLK